MTIRKMHAIQLAETYHEAMTMVRTRSMFKISATKSPRAVLEGYLQVCKMLDVRLHNETWEAEAEAVVQELTQKRRDAWAKALRSADHA
jgi:N-acetylmuramic acid 6-phosphate (MurNAc-6-P) etherase